MSRVALIAADEKMLLELGHILNLQDFGQRGGRLRGSGGAARRMILL
jgi:hypothetical protein